MRWVILLYFTISVLLKSGLKIGAAFGGKNLIFNTDVFLCTLYVSMYVVFVICIVDLKSFVELVFYVCCDMYRL